MPVGTLFSVNQISLSTTNILTPKMSWPTTNTIAVLNMKLTYRTVVNDVTNGNISHVNLPNIICNNLDKLTFCEAVL